MGQRNNSIEPDDIDDDIDLDVEEHDDSDDDRDDDRDDRDDDREPRRRASRSAARALRRERQRSRALEERVDQLSKLIQKKGIGTEPNKDKVDIEAMRKQLLEEVRAEVNGDANARILVTEAKSALREAGFVGDARRGVRLLDLDDIEVSSGRVNDDDLDDAIEALKEESPELFRRSSRTNRDNTNGRRRSRDADEEYDDEEPRTRRTRRSATEGMSRERNGGGKPMNSMERALRDLVGAPRRRD